MAEPTYELYDGDPDAGGTKVGEVRYDLTNGLVIIRHEGSGEEATLDAAGFNVSDLITAAISGTITSSEITNLEGTALSVVSNALGITDNAVTPTQLDESMSPTWTGPHTWNGAIQNYERAEPGSGAVVFKKLVDTTSGDELRWKLTTSGLIKVVIWDASASVERDLWEVDPATQATRQLATLSFPSLAGSPTFANHDHTGDLAQIVTAGIADEAITEPKLDALDTPADGEVLAWNQSSGQFEWVASGGGGGSNHMSVSIPHTEWSDGLSSVEVHRISLASGETLEVHRVDVKLKTGGTLANFTFDVFDETNSTVLASTSDLVQGSPIATSGDGADVIVRVSNGTSNIQVGSCSIRLVVVG